MNFNTEIDRRSLLEIFISTFHNKMSFDEFLRLNIQGEFNTFSLRNRIIYAPSDKLKKIHRFLNKSIFEYADFNEDVVFSYRKGVSARDAIERHAESDFFFQTDLSNFYRSIRLADVRLALDSQLNNIPVSDVADYIEKIIGLVVVDDHIPAGFSTSPLLSNICLLRFDNALLKYCENESLIYTRYSDDLIISGGESGFSQEIEGIIEDLLKEHVNMQMQVNKSKTKFHKKGRRNKILGFSILPNGVVTIPSSDKKEIENLLFFYLTDSSKFESYVKKTMNIPFSKLEGKSIRELGISSLSGRLIALNSMDREYVSKLRRKYGNTLIDMFIRKTVK